jgi:hypothetical protein
MNLFKNSLNGDVNKEPMWFFTVSLENIENEENINESVR